MSLFVFPLEVESHCVIACFPVSGILHGAFPGMEIKAQSCQTQRTEECGTSGYFPLPPTPDLSPLISPMKVRSVLMKEKNMTVLYGGGKDAQNEEIAFLSTRRV